MKSCQSCMNYMMQMDYLVKEKVLKKFQTNHLPIMFCKQRAQSQCIHRGEHPQA